jgi:hypothetical protein
MESIDRPLFFLFLRKPRDANMYYCTICVFRMRRTSKSSKTPSILEIQKSAGKGAQFMHDQT